MAHRGELEVMTEQPRKRSRPICLAAIAAAVCAIGLITILICYFATMYSTPDPTSYAIIFDAGSSGTRMFIYKWDGTKAHGWNSTPIIDQIDDCYPERSLSSYADPAATPSDAGPGLERCLKQAMDKLPPRYHRKTPVYVAATAGMRLLKEKNSNVTDAIFNSVRSTLRSSSFVFVDDHARIISDLEEGIFAWMTVNYLNVKFDYIHKLRGKTDGTLGTLDMGGASAQISFVPDPKETGVQSNYTMAVQMFGTNYTVYSHSFLCYGKNEAYRRMLVALLKRNSTRNGTTVTVPQPCAPRNAPIAKGYNWLSDSTCTKALMNETLKTSNISFVGTGDPAKCAKLVPSLFDKTLCTSSQCSFDGVYQPHLKGIFLALSAFFYTYQFYNFTNTTASTTLETFQESVYSYCNKTWGEVSAVNVPDSWKPYLSQYCFDGHYVIAVLQSLGFNSTTWTDIITTETMSGTTVGWTLGLLVSEINSMDAITVHVVSKVPMWVFVSLLVFFGVLFLVALVLLVKACRMKY